MRKRVTKQQVIALLLCIILIFSLTDCTHSDASSSDTQTDVTEDEQQETDSETVQEPDSSAESPAEDSESETGNFEELDVEDNIEITLDEGESAAGG